MAESSKATPTDPPGSITPTPTDDDGSGNYKKVMHHLMQRLKSYPLPKATLPPGFREYYLAAKQQEKLKAQQDLEEAAQAGMEKDK